MAANRVRSFSQGISQGFKWWWWWRVQLSAASKSSETVILENSRGDLKNKQENKALDNITPRKEANAEAKHFIVVYFFIWVF